MHLMQHMRENAAAGAVNQVRSRTIDLLPVVVSVAEILRDSRHRPLIAQGDNRYLRALGARRTKASGGQDGECLPCVRVSPY
jgi:hypothetical protein